MNNTELQKEPINPVMVLKCHKHFAPHKAYSLETPFKITIGKDSVEIKEGEKPVYFKRKQLQIKGANIELTNIKYAVGIEKNKIKKYSFYTPLGVKLEDVVEEVK